FTTQPSALSHSQLTADCEMPTASAPPDHSHGNSPGSNIWRTSVSPSQPGQCFLWSSMKATADSIASCLDFSSNCAKPPIISLASVKGPSITVTLPPERRTRAPCAVGLGPPFPSMVPALASSSAILAMASINGLGGGPCFSECLTIIMNRMVFLPYLFSV